MPPARNRAAQDDTKDTKDKTGAGVGKGRKNALNNKEAKAEAAAAANAEASTSQAQASVCPHRHHSENSTDHFHSQLAWQKEDVSTLLRYRSAYTLDTPPSFTSLQHQAILSNPGIGRLSPSMIRKGTKKYQPKDALATAVRKHFNAVPVNEPDVLLQFICKVKQQGRTHILFFRVQSNIP